MFVLVQKKTSKVKEEEMDTDNGHEICLNLNRHRQRLFDVLVGIGELAEGRYHHSPLTPFLHFYQFQTFLTQKGYDIYDMSKAHFQRA